MNKNLIIKLIILLVVAMLVYSIFWFFKIGQVEKKINNFISDNSLNVSAGDVEVSGFPFSQKIKVRDFKFTIPSSFLANRQIIVKEFEANAGVFSNDFEVDLKKDAVFIQLDENNLVNIVFNRTPNIDFSIGDNGFSKASYRDIGYKIINDKQELIYSSSALVANFESSMRGDAIVNKINVDAREIEGIDIISIYKNSLEKKINDALKTGEISLGSVANKKPVDNLTEVANQVVAAQEMVSAVKDAMQNPDLTNEQAKSLASSATAIIKGDVAQKANLENPADSLQIKKVNEKELAGEYNGVADPVCMDDPKGNSLEVGINGLDHDTDCLRGSGDLKPIESQNPALVERPVKNSLIMSLEYSLIPQSQELLAPLDPMQIHDLPVQYSKVIKINNLEFSNNSYKIFVNGQLNIFQDDDMPSGSVSVKVEKINNVINILSKDLKPKLEEASAVSSSAQDKILDEASAVENNDQAQNLKATPETQLLTDGAMALPTKDISSQDQVSLASTVAKSSLEASIDNIEMPINPVVEDPYQNFLIRVSDNLDLVSKELASKNAASQEDVAVFDVRREKNLEFLINETSIREILGKF